MRGLFPILQTAGRLLLERMDLRRSRALGKRLSRTASAQKLYWSWIWSLYVTPPTAIPGLEKLTVVLQSYRRPWNMDRLVRAAARCVFVDKIILSNNNPDYDLRPLLRVRDPRLELIQNRVRRRPAFRWHLAREARAEYILAVDDDIFIAPAQMARLFEALIREPDVPHGLFGTCYQGTPTITWRERRKTESYVYCQETTVDVLHQIYAVHRTQVDRYYQLLEGPGIQLPLTFGDDIVISFASPGRPRVHDLGPVLSCPTSRRPGIAVHRDDHFFPNRQALWKACQRLSPRHTVGTLPE